MKEPWKQRLADAKYRCGNSSSRRYARYGARGIRCYLTDSEIRILWFRDDACKMERPSLDRIDNEGDYEFYNCQFIEKSENSSKRKRDRIIEVRRLRIAGEIA